MIVNLNFGHPNWGIVVGILLVFICISLIIDKGFPGGSVVKNLPAMQETQVQYLGGEDPLEEGMATHSSILVWRIPWAVELGGLQSVGLQRVGHD